MNRIDICKNIIQSINEYITNPDNLEPHREKKHFIRKRKLSLFQVILYLLYSSKASMFQNLSCIREDLPSLDFPSVSKQALSKARQFINPSLFKELFYLSVDLFYSQLPSRRLWHGYHLLAVDGSKIELPNSSSNFEFFGEMFGYPDPSRRFTMGLASIVYDVLDDYIVHASFQRYLASERAAALEHLKNLEALNIYQDSIAIFDRGYYSENFFRYCVEHGHLCLIASKKGTISQKNVLATSTPFFQAIPGMVPLTLMSVSLKSLLMTAQKNISLPTFSICSSHRQCFRNFIFIAGRWKPNIKS